MFSQSCPPLPLVYLLVLCISFAMQISFLKKDLKKKKKNSPTNFKFIRQNFWDSLTKRAVKNFFHLYTSVVNSCVSIT